MPYTTIFEAAEDYLIAGLSVLPCKEDKRPTRSEWTSLQSLPMPLEDAETEFKNAAYIAVITGAVSGNVELIDFDAHEKGITEIFEAFKRTNAELFTKYAFYIERSKRGGFHILYKIDSDNVYGSRVLARWESKETMIETKGDRGYCIVAPSAGYEVITGSLTNLPTIRPDERDALMEAARALTQVAKGETTSGEEETHHDYIDPVSFYNWNKSEYSKNLLRDNGWKSSGGGKDKEEQWTRPGKSEGMSATWGHKHNALYVFSSNAEPFKLECFYTPFQILIMLKFDGSYFAAINWISAFYLKLDTPYMRIGVDYFKKIGKKDRFGIKGTELKKWKKDEIKDDHGAKYMQKIPKYDNFCLSPDNKSYSPVVDNCYNLYNPFRHIETAGEFKWSRILMEHIFGEQVALGYRYLQCLYLHPEKMLPIVVLVSTERMTGKTTFLNWLNMIFGDNCVMINPSDLTSDFNSSYATANIIEIEETLIEKSLTVEKLKALATGKFVSVNEKFISNYKVPFYGKIIMASNNEHKFAKVDEDEIRFFVRKVGTPKHFNHNIEEELMVEIPAFLNHLSSLPPVDFSVGRVPFTTEEMKNESLTMVKAESMSEIYKDMFERFVDLFNNLSKPAAEIYATATDIKTKFYLNNSQYSVAYIKKTLRDDFRMQPEPLQRYVTLGEDTITTRVGRPYKFNCETFGVANPEPEEELPF